MKTKCPLCGDLNAEEVADLVDIGVGNQKRLLGYECENCGTVPVCDCGGIGGDHAKWCIDLSL